MRVLALALPLTLFAPAACDEGGSGSANEANETETSETDRQDEASGSSSALTPLTLPLPGPLYPGHFGTSRCTLMRLPWARLGLPGPVFQCGGERFLTVHEDGRLDEVEVALEGRAISVSSLAFGLQVGIRGKTLWVGERLLRVQPSGVERVRPGPERQPERVPYPSEGLEGTPRGAVADGDALWLWTDDTLFRGVATEAGHRFTRVLSLVELVGQGPPPGLFVSLAPLGGGEALLHHADGMDGGELYRLTAEGPSPLPVPAASATSRSGGGGGGGGGEGAGSGGAGGGGAEAPPRHRVVRVGERVLVGTADARLLELRGERLTPLEVVPPLRRRGADNLALRGHSAGGADGTVALVLGGRLYVCDDERCRAHEGPSSWGWVEPGPGSRFLALRAAPRDAPLTGAVLVDAAPILAAP